MATRKILLVAGALAAATLSGCAVYPNDPYYDGYRGGYAEPGYYGPGYYSGPSVGLGITYSDRYYGGDRRYYREREREHEHDRDRDR
jgi:hypothetical protein